MKLLVTGGRHYADRARVYAELDNLHAQHGIALVIHGDATGADSYADLWAEENGVPCDPHPAMWYDLNARPCKIAQNWYGKAYNLLAGFNRNQKMIDLRPDLVIAFPGGSGTEDMIRRAEKAGVPVRRVE